MKKWAPFEENLSIFISRGTVKASGMTSSPTRFASNTAPGKCLRGLAFLLRAAVLLHPKFKEEIPPSQYLWQWMYLTVQVESGTKKTYLLFVDTATLSNV